MYVYMLARIYTYTYILNAICILKKKGLGRGGSGLHMQGVRPVKYNKYKFVLVLMGGGVDRTQVKFPRQFPFRVYIREQTAFTH